MPAHLRKRSDCGGIFYIVDGAYVRSTRSKVRRYADAKLREYLDGNHGLLPLPTVQQFYDKWIETKIEPLFRRSAIRGYRQHFTCYILPKFKDVSLASIDTAMLEDFRFELVRKKSKGGRGLSVRTAKGIIGGSFKAFYRDARIKYEDLKKLTNPFLDLGKWKADQTDPDPFTHEEQERILDCTHSDYSFFYPWVFNQFFTGMRPSESTALRLKDIDFDKGTASINKSRHLGAEAGPKTTASRRIIYLPSGVLDLIRAIRLPWETPNSFVFYNRVGGPINAGEWARNYWRKILDGAKVSHRKFYSTRHTFITEALRRGESPKAVADHCGTSLNMIEKNYCAKLRLQHDPTETQRTGKGSEVETTVKYSVGRPSSCNCTVS